MMKTTLIALILMGSVTAMPAFAVSPIDAPAAPITAIELAPKAVDAFHQSHGSGLVWGDDTDFEALMNALAGLDNHGLTPSHYHFEALAAARADKTKRDRLATDAWFSAAAHMVEGKLDPKLVEPDWTAARRSVDLPAKLISALDAGTVALSLDALAPKQAGYATLKDEYARQKAVATEPRTLVVAGETLKPKMKGARVTAMQTRLIELGLLDAVNPEAVFDAATEIAVKTLQLSHELDDDGIVGAATLAAMNRGPEEQLSQVRVNLERWRWLPDDLGKRHVRANIAGFNVTTWEDGVAQRTHLAIVGKAYRKTPVFSDEIEYAVFNPWWETPSSLARADKLPLFKRDPGAVQRLGFQILDRSGAVVDPSTIDWNAISASAMPYRIRQKPGPLNALGQVKIIFPNAHNVYLHDTPTRDLFAQRQRAFSSGCMRTQYPVELAKWLLKDTPEWTPEKIDAAVTSGTETRANLVRKIPVHILYFTTVSETDGAVRYLDDIYQRDGAVLTGLNALPRRK